MRPGLPRWTISAVIRAAVAIVSGNALGCASAGQPPLLGPPREQPASLTGRWAAVSDTGQWRGTVFRWLVLRADGEQWTESAPDSTRDSIRDSIRDTTGADVPQRDGPRAWWWVYRGVNGAPDQLCLHWRAGRHRADCALYRLDTVQVGGRAALRLRWNGAEWIAAR
jgi:hypothetical protein